MFRLRRPSDATAEGFRRRQSAMSLTYNAVGATRDDITSPPPGYAFNRARASLGAGRDTFDRAVALLRRWRQFDIGWAEAFPNSLSISPGETVVVRVRTFGVWSLHACRIVYVLDQEGPVTRFGFGYGTLPGHAEMGEERFLIEWDHATDLVSYEVSAFFRPRHPLARLGWPIGKRLVNDFRRDSAEAMQKSVAQLIATSVQPSA